MILFWIFAIFCAATGFAFAYLVLQWGLVYSFLYGVGILLLVRGLFSLGKRWLVLRERVPDEDDADTRTLETNRYIFWRRVVGFSILLGLYFGGANLLFGLGPEDALAILPSFLVTAFTQLIYLFFLLGANFMLFFGPFLLFGRMGRETIEPGDANYEVKIEDVRGQKSAVSEMTRILRLIEQGRNYVKAGGKRERGVLMVGPPGTGKTMLAKAIASSLRMPIIISSGAAFQGMFMGMDMVAVYMTVRAAKKKAKRWGGCSIFIDEFDALGNRRQGMGGMGGGAMGGMFGGGQLGLNMLLVQMDGVDNPGFFKKLFRRMVNVTMDGLFLPRKIGLNGHAVSLRIPQLRPPRYNLFFMGATNRPQVLDEAVTRPGRFGRQIKFHMPTRDDRKDIAELYFGKKAHDPALDSPEKRAEFARVTEGYSPAMIEQATSLALMYAFEDGRPAFNWKDLRESMGNIEAGLVEPIEHSERDKISIARHELGHAVAAHMLLPDHEHARLSIKKRGDTGGHHRAIEREERFNHFRSEMAADIRHFLGSIAAERTFYGENSNGVYGDLRSATQIACHMVGLVGMGPEELTPEMSRKAISIGQHLISGAELSGGGMDLAAGPNWVGATLGNPVSRRVVAQILGSAYIDDWRLMYANKEAIDEAAQALIAQGELVGDEITGLLDSVGLKMPDEDTPYPEDMPKLPDLEEERKPRVVEAS